MTRAESVSHRKDVIEDAMLSSLVLSKGLRRNNTTGCTGVYQDKKRGTWTACIDFQKKRYFLGVFSESETAIQARKYAERRLHDPIIQEKLDSLTDASRKKFLEYLKNIPENSSNCLKRTTVQSTEKPQKGTEWLKWKLYYACKKINAVVPSAAADNAVIYKISGILTKNRIV